MLAIKCQVHGSSGPLSRKQGRCVAMRKGVMAGNGRTYSLGPVVTASTKPHSIFPTCVTELHKGSFV